MLRLQRFANPVMNRVCWNAGRGTGFLWSLVIVVSLGLWHSERVAAADAMPRSSPSPVGMEFAYADLDGDRKPDLALVEIESVRASSTNYEVRLEFSGGLASSIGVKGPLGGLRLAVRDVNGDDSLDLILTSAADRHVIQVLLNDGRGQFAAAEMEQYSSLETQGELGLSEREPGPSDRLALAGTRTFFDAEFVQRIITNLRDEGFAGAMPDSEVVAARETGSKFGRSPPQIPSVS